MVNDDEQRLLEQICAAPHDVQLRSVYADLLIARGDVERGEYTALGVEWLGVHYLAVQLAAIGAVVACNFVGARWIFRARQAFSYGKDTT